MDTDYDTFDMEDYIEKGVLVDAGVDDDGERLYSWNPDRLLEVNPVLHAQMMQYWAEEVDEALMGLAQKGLIEIEFDDHLNAEAVLSELGRQVYFEDIEEEG